MTSGHRAGGSSLTPGSIHDRASMGQTGLWLLDQLAGQDDPAYHIAMAIEADAPIDEAALEESLNRLIRHQDALASSFVAHDDHVDVRKSHRRVHLVKKRVPRGPLLPRLQREVERPFDLSKGPLVRASMFGHGRGALLLIVIHHIVFDEGSRDVFWRELDAIYGDVSKGPRDIEFPGLSFKFRDFASKQHQTAKAGGFADDLAFWRSQLRELPDPVVLNPLPVHRGGRYPGQTRSLALPPSVMPAIRRSAAELGLTPHMLLLLALEGMILRISGQDSFTVGTVVDGRPSRDFDNVVGYFTNPLVLPADVALSFKLREAAERVRLRLMEALRHRGVPFALVVDDVDPPRHPGRHPLFQIALVVYRGDREITLFGQRARLLNIQPRAAQFDITLFVDPGRDSLEAYWEYRTDMFDEAAIDRLSNMFRKALDFVTGSPDRSFRELALADQAELRRLNEWGAARTEPSNATLLDLLDAQVRRRGSTVAIDMPPHQLSYSQLDELANRIAGRMAAQGVGAGDGVAVLIERGPLLIASLIAVLRSGAFYLPLEANSPQSRLGFMMRDAGVRHALADAKGRSAIKEFDGVVVSAEEAQGYPLMGDSLGPAADDPAYLIYTSGSTGIPKGVLVTHRNVTSLIESTQRLLKRAPHDRWSMFHSAAFDFSVWEMWGCLAAGATLCPVPADVAGSPAEFRDFLAERRVTILNQTPTSFYELIDADQAAAEPLALRIVIFGGERLAPERLAAWVARYGVDHPRLVNMYGITETTVHVTWRELGTEDIRRGGSPLGRPLPSVSLHILDDDLHPVPVGVIGELCVGGSGVAIGYLGRARETSERFVPDSFVDAGGRRMYRSGDLGCYAVDGDVQYVGRADAQIKVRGYRIELGEIEAALIETQGVMQAAVIADGEGADRRLVGFVVTSPDESIDEELVRASLSTSIPEYMVPSRILTLQRLPLTSNGKIDRHALAATMRSSDSEVHGGPPVGATEAFLAGVWTTVLNRTDVGRGDNLFAMGGNSLLAARIAGRLKAAGFGLTLRTIFEHPTIAELAAYLDRRTDRPASAP
jgi:amino acid adenylation domain-containing protein